MNILITGGAGFIGSHLAEYHLKKGDAVFAIDDLSSGIEANITPFQKNPNFEFEHTDILHWTSINEKIAWADRIYHMAAVVGVYKVLEEPIKVLTVNILGFEKLLHAIKLSHVRPKIIIASSSEVYGPHNEPALKEDMNLIIEAAAKNRWHYAVSKLADESFALAFQKKMGISSTIIRLFNTIGPRQTGRYGMVVPRFVAQAMNNESITVFGEGSQTRSFCDVRDTVVMLDLLAENEDAVGETINVGNDREITMKDLAILVKKLAGSRSEIEYIPYEQAYSSDYVDIKRRKPDLNKLFSYIQFKHQWTLEDSITDLMNNKKT